METWIEAILDLLEARVLAVAGRHRILYRIDMSTIDYGGEFGYELISVLPYAYYLFTQGRLAATISSKDTQCLYFFSPHHEERYARRCYQPLTGFPVQTLCTHDIDTQTWTPPPFKQRFHSTRFQWSKPLLVLCNKCELQWGEGPINCIDVPLLRTLLTSLTPHYQIVYSNPPKTAVVDDDCAVAPFGDKEMIRSEFPDVTLVEDLYAHHTDLTFNAFQCTLYASCENFISVQGGGSVLASYFGGRNYVLAVDGDETTHDSYRGYFRRFSGCTVLGFRTRDAFQAAILADYIVSLPPQ